MTENHHKNIATEPIQVLVVDDHPIVREGLKRKIEQRPDMIVCYEAERIGQALRYLSRNRVNIAIVDISLKGRSGIELIKQIRKMGETFPVLVLSIHDETTYVQRAMAAGAQGYLLKNEAPWEIIQAIRKLMEGEYYISQRLMQKMIGILTLQKNREEGVEMLSDRELEVLEAVGKGMTTRQIGESLNLSTSTIETHKSRIKSKLKLRNAAELSTYAANWIHSRHAAL